MPQTEYYGLQHEIVTQCRELRNKLCVEIGKGNCQYEWVFMNLVRKLDDCQKTADRFIR